MAARSKVPEKTEIARYLESLRELAMETKNNENGVIAP